MRDYYPIWRKLKQSLQLPDSERLKGVSVTQNRGLHARTLKAVIKEKWMDIGFKIAIEPRKAILSHTRNGTILTFYLEYWSAPEPERTWTTDDF